MATAASAAMVTVAPWRVTLCEASRPASSPLLRAPRSCAPVAKPDPARTRPRRHGQWVEPASWPYPVSPSKEEHREKALAVGDFVRRGAGGGGVELRLEPPRGAEHLAGPDGRRHRRLCLH